MTKREFLRSGVAVAGLAALSGAPLLSMNVLSSDILVDDKGDYTLPPLPYAYNALEPHIDEQTMRLHHDIHHLGYVNGLNKAAAELKKATETGDFSLVKHWEREAAFHGSGHFLHTIFWNVMGPNQGSRSALLERYITKDFGSFDKMKALFSAASNAVEASGWGILAYQPGADRLVVLQAEKHQNLTQWITIPIL